MFAQTLIDGHLMFSTVLIKTARGIGIAFIFNLLIDEKTIPISITNKHVSGKNQIEEVFF